MNRAFNKSLWWWGGLVLRCILLASPIRSRWLKYFSNSFCSQQIWFCALKGFTRKNLKFNCSNLSWLDIVKNMNKFQCHGNLFVGRQMKKQFANRNRSLNSFIYLWTLIHDSSFRAINVLFWWIQKLTTCSQELKIRSAWSGSIFFPNCKHMIIIIMTIIM